MTRLHSSDDEPYSYAVMHTMTVFLSNIPVTAKTIINYEMMQQLVHCLLTAGVVQLVQTTGNCLVSPISAVRNVLGVWQSLAVVVLAD